MSLDEILDEVADIEARIKMEAMSRSVEVPTSSEIEIELNARPTQKAAPKSIHDESERIPKEKSEIFEEDAKMKKFREDLERQRAKMMEDLEKERAEMVKQMKEQKKKFEEDIKMRKFQEDLERQRVEMIEDFERQRAEMVEQMKQQKKEMEDTLDSMNKKNISAVSSDATKSNASVNNAIAVTKKKTSLKKKKSSKKKSVSLKKKKKKTSLKKKTSKVKKKKSLTKPKVSKVAAKKVKKESDRIKGLKARKAKELEEKRWEIYERFQRMKEDREYKAIELKLERENEAKLKAYEHELMLEFGLDDFPGTNSSMDVNSSEVVSKYVLAHKSRKQKELKAKKRDLFDRLKQEKEDREQADAELILERQNEVDLKRYEHELMAQFGLDDIEGDSE